MGKSFTTREEAEAYAAEKGLGSRKLSHRHPETGATYTSEVGPIEPVGTAFVVHEDDGTPADDGRTVTGAPVRRTAGLFPDNDASADDRDNAHTSAAVKRAARKAPGGKDDNETVKTERAARKRRATTRKRR